MHGISYFLKFILNKKTDTSKKNKIKSMLCKK